MANETTNNKTKIDLLYEYTNERFDIQDRYYESCYKGLRNMIAWLWILLFACWAINHFALIHEFGKLEHRVAGIEQTWSE